MNPKTYLLIGGVIIAMIIIWTILKRIGIIPKTGGQKVSAEKQKRKLREEKAAIIIQNSKGFNIDFWKSAPQGKLMNSMQYSPIVKGMRKAMKGWGTDESGFTDSLLKVKNLYQLSQVAYYYSEFYKRSLTADMLDEFNKGELGALTIYIQALKT